MARTSWRRRLSPRGLPLAGGTLTGDLIVDGAVEIERGATSGIALSITKTDTGGNPVVRMIHPDNTGNGQRPFNARRDGESDYFEVNGRLGGSNDNPGIAFGTGSGVRDARLWRGGANLLETDDALQVAELRIGGTLATTRTNLGLGTAATEDTGTASGDIAVLGTGGAFVADRIPNLNAGKITAGAFSSARIPNLAASKIKPSRQWSPPASAAARLTIQRCWTAPGHGRTCSGERTLLRSTTMNDWVSENATRTLTFSGDIDDYAYITVTAVQSTGDRATADTVTVPTSMIPTGVQITAEVGPSVVLAGRNDGTSKKRCGDGASFLPGHHLHWPHLRHLGRRLLATLPRRDAVG